MNPMAQLEFELAYFEATVLYVSHYATRIYQEALFLVNWWVLKNNWVWYWKSWNHW